LPYRKWEKAMLLVTDRIANYHLAGAGAGTQCFPFYMYSDDGSHQRENITDWALEQFRSHYHDLSITKWDIFYYVYAVLHHPEYRQRYAANLRRELPRIPFVAGSDSGGSMPPSWREYGMFEKVCPFNYARVYITDVPCLGATPEHSSRHARTHIWVA
jgi:hypothetical protein